MILNKYNLDINNKDDILLSKNFLLKKKAKIRVGSLHLKMQTRVRLNLSNSSNSKIFILFLSFFFFFFLIRKLSIVKGSQNRILYFQYYIENIYLYSFLSFFYYFSKYSDLNDFLFSKFNNISGKILVGFSFTILKNFLTLYSKEEEFLDIVEENFVISIMNKF